MENSIEIDRDTATELAELSLSFEYGEISKELLAEKASNLVRQYILNNDLILIKILKA